MRGKALVLLFALMMALVLCQTAVAGEGTCSVREYSLPANATEIGAMAVDASGNVWLIQDEPPVLYKLVRENGTFSNYTIEGFARAQFTGLSVDELGIAWFTDMTCDGFGAYDERNNQTADFPFNSWNRMAPSSIVRRGDSIWIGCNAEFGEYDLRFPDEPLIDHFVYHWDSYLQDIHFDRFGNVWAVEYEKNNVTVYWRMYDKTSEFAIPTEKSYPTRLSIDSLGRLWFVESATNKLGMFHTELFNFSEYEIPVIDGTMPHIADVETIGDTIWLTDVNMGRVLRFYPDEGRFAVAWQDNDSALTFVEADSGGTLWFYESGSKKLASLNLTGQSGQVTPTPGPAVTIQPTATVTPQPTKTPGFLALAPIVALGLALYASRARK